MNALFFVIGLALGVLQLFLTKKTVDLLTGKNIGRILIFVTVKLTVYAVGVSVMFIFMRNYILPFGIGFAVGMIVCAFANFIITISKDKSTEKGDDTP